jgi:hypothetical protein
LLIGLLVRIAIGSGMALEVFYLLTGYTWRQYLITTCLGVAIWVTQALVGVTMLRSLSQLSPLLAVVVSIALPLIGAGGVLALRQHRQRQS